MLIYLAGPYTHANPEVMEQRYQAHCALAAQLTLDNSFTVISPIILGHSMSKHMPAEAQCDRDFWLQKCLQWLKACHAMYVFSLPDCDYKQSAGTVLEVGFASRQAIPTVFLGVFNGGAK